MKPTSSTADISPTHEQIATRAQVLWQARGQPQGRDEEIWLEAERQLKEENREILGGVPRGPSERERSQPTQPRTTR